MQYCCRNGKEIKTKKITYYIFNNYFISFKNCDIVLIYFKNQSPNKSNIDIVPVARLFGLSDHRLFNICRSLND